jgi:hypothetical protein
MLPMYFIDSNKSIYFVELFIYVYNLNLNAKEKLCGPAWCLMHGEYLNGVQI